MKTVFCRRCGAQIAPGTVKCSSCGAIQKQNKKKKTPVRKPSRAAIYAVAAVALLAVVVVLMCFMGGVFDFSGRETNKMPGVVGLTEEAARQQLEELGLHVTVKTESSEEAAGIVTAQSIPEGRNLKGNQSVKLTVSNGSGSLLIPEETTGEEEAEFSAPSVVGELFDAAQMRTESVGLNLVIGLQQHSNDPKGTILAQDPQSGTKMQRGQAVEVTVSLGPEDAHIITATAGKGGSVSPNGRITVNNGEDAAFSILAEEGFVLEELEIDGRIVDPDANYTFVNVMEDHSLYAVFRAAEPGEENSETGNDPEKPKIAASPSDL